MMLTEDCINFGELGPRACLESLNIDKTASRLQLIKGLIPQLFYFLIAADEAIPAAKEFTEKTSYTSITHQSKFVVQSCVPDGALRI